MKLDIDISDDLGITVGDSRVCVSPGEAFQLAERLIRCATTRMIVEETDRHTDGEHRHGRK